MSSMHIVSKFMLDDENCEKQWFCKQWDKTQHKINATHANFLASMDRKSILSHAENLVSQMEFKVNNFFLKNNSDSSSSQENC